MENEYIHPMCKINYKTGEITKVMCRKVKTGALNHYGTEWDEYEDKDGNKYYGR